jgi:hypothetical protein
VTRPEAIPDVSANERSEKVTAAAFAVIRRALVEGVPVTREGLVGEAAFALDTTPAEAVKELDMVAQRIGVGSVA